MEETTQKIDPDEVHDSEKEPIVEDSQEVSTTEASEESPKRKKRMVIGAVAAVAVVAVVGVGAAFALSQQPAAEVNEPSTVSEPTENAQTTQARAKKDEKSEVKLSIKAEGADETATKSKVVVKDANGKIVVEETEVAANTETSLGELHKGEYELQVVAVPVAEDGSTFKVPDAPVKFTIDGKGDAVKVESTLTKLAKEEMSKEQLEAAANILTEAGKSDAANNVAQAAQTAPSAPNNAESASNPGSTGGSDAPSTPSTPDPAPAPTPNPPSPTQPSHTCTFEPLYETVWVSDGLVPDYDNERRVYYCSTHGIDFASGDECVAHALAGDCVTGSRPEYPMIETGHNEIRLIGYSSCPICGATG